jgi:hypothetical protein
MHVHTIALHYPSSFLAPVHPDHEAARRDTERWLRGLGVVADERSERTFAEMNVGWYGGAPFPDAPYDALVTIMEFFTLWIFHDDVLEGLGMDAPHVLGAAVRGEPAQCPLGSPHVRGFWELGCRFRAARSDRWLARFSGRFRAWIGSLGAEAELARAIQSTGQQPSFAAYMEVRGLNIGVLPTVCWIEHAADRELSPEILADPYVARAEALAGRIVALQNDIAGFDKDARRGWPNAVLSLGAERGASPLEAFARAAELHDRAVASLAAICQAIVKRHGDAARFWVKGLCRMVGGLAQWHLRTPRYSATLPGGDAVRVVLREGMEGDLGAPRAA